MKNKTTSGKCAICAKKPARLYGVQNPRFTYEEVPVCRECFLRKDFWRRFGEYIDGIYGEK